MAVGIDSDAKLAGYARPDRLVTTAWLADHLDHPELVVMEADEDVALYDTGHIPGAAKIDWQSDLNDQANRDYIDGERFADLMSANGVERDTTVVLYGDKNNWWAAYAVWVFCLFGHPDVRLLDGGRMKWLAEQRPCTLDVPKRERTDYPVVRRDDTTTRAFKDDVRAHLGRPILDVRSPGEYTGELLHMPEYPQEGSVRGGHIPGAVNVPWGRAAADDGTFRSRTELERIYQEGAGLNPRDDVVTYCRVGERSSHTWFVLTFLLGFRDVRNYDGSWTEWGNAVRTPIVIGSEPGLPPRRHPG